MQYSKDEMTAFILLKVLYDNACEEWNQMRNLLKNDTKTEEIDAYFEKIFGSGIKERLLQPDTALFRARQIKTKDWDETGVVKDKISEQAYSIIIKPEDLKLFNDSGDLFVSADNVLLYKLANMKKFTGKQLKQFDALNKKYSAPSFYGFSALKSGSPPKKFRQNQRLSTKNDNYLYLAMDIETAIYEMRPAINQSYSVAKGKLKKPVRLAELQDVSKYDEFTDFAIGNIISKISEPNTDNDIDFYRITQRLAHFIKAKKFDGIVYKSSIKDNGVNILLFNPKSVQFTETSVVSIDSIKVDFHIDFPFNNKDTD